MPENVLVEHDISYNGYLFVSERRKNAFKIHGVFPGETVSEQVSNI